MWHWLWDQMAVRSQKGPEEFVSESLKSFKESVNRSLEEATGDDLMENDGNII